MSDYKPRARRSRDQFLEAEFPRVEPLDNFRPAQPRPQVSQPEYTFSEPVDDFQFHLAPADQELPRRSLPTEEFPQSSRRSDVPISREQPSVVDEEELLKNKAVHGHNVARIMLEIVVTALISMLGIGALSWISDRVALKFLSENYTPASNSLHVTSALIAFATVIVFGLFYLGLDKITGAARGLYTALTWVIIVGAVAYVVLTSLSVYAVVYLVLAFGVAIPLSYIPNIVTSNRYVNS